MLNNNCAFISGNISEPFKYKFKKNGERFFETKITTERLSDTLDEIPVIVSENVLDVSQDYTGVFSIICGRVSTYNKPKGGGKSKLEVYVFANSISFPEYPTIDSDHVCFDGFVCKPPVLRETPLGRTVCDFLMAVNRNYIVSDYIPCICWGKTARFMSGIEVGSHVFIQGRLQSRDYIKKISDSEREFKKAYEVSAYKIVVMDNEERRVKNERSKN